MCSFRRFLRQNFITEKVKFMHMPTEREHALPPPPPDHFHTQQPPSCSYTSWEVIFHLTTTKKGTASFPASTKSNFPNHSAAYLGIITCRFARPLWETQGTVFRKIKQRISGWLHLKIVPPNNLNHFSKKQQLFYELEYNFWFSNYLSRD